jgi:uncharacterized protein YggE
MKYLKIILALIYACIFVPNIFSQASGNVNYSKSDNQNNRKGSSIIVPVAQFEKDNSIIIEANTLYNAQADNFVAIFNLNQLGETAGQANEILENRIKGIKDGFVQSGIKEKDIFIDMLTFVPEYEYEVTKKIFSKTYNEVPKGFRIQKNIHVRYSNSKKLDQLISICAKYEVYDLVKVEYYANDSRVYYDSLRVAAKKILKAKLKDYKDLGINTDNAMIQISENAFVIYPVEKYDSYYAYSSSSLDAVKKSANINNVEKNNSLYYNPVSEKGYDYVFNPVITEPVIQYALTMKMRIELNDPKLEPKAEYYMLSPNGTLIPIKK